MNTTQTDTQTDTPETDAEVERLRLLRYHCAPQNDPQLGADFARKLERARDTAMKQSAEWEELFHRFGRKSREMEAERDAALCELAELRKLATPMTTTAKLARIAAKCREKIDLCIRNGFKSGCEEAAWRSTLAAIESVKLENRGSSPSLTARESVLIDAILAAWPDELL